MAQKFTRTIKINVFGAYDKANNMQRVGEKTSINESIPAEGSVIYALEGSKTVLASMDMDTFMKHATITDKVKEG